MRIQNPLKTELIIGMTLAETFLLILFVVWYSQGPESERLTKQREFQIQELQKEVRDKEEEILQLERIRDFWRNNYGVSAPTSFDELQVALQPQGLTITKVNEATLRNAARSNLTPKCSELGLRDLLFSTVIRGRESYEINGETKNFQELLTAYNPDLQEAERRQCKYLVNVSYQPNVTTDEFVFALRRLRTEFYVQLP